MYSPRLKDSQIKKVYVVAKQLKWPMTDVVRVAVDEFLTKYGQMPALDKKTRLKGYEGAKKSN
jgi:hypothetical protein